MSSKIAKDARYRLLSAPPSPPLGRGTFLEPSPWPWAFEYKNILKRCVRSAPCQGCGSLLGTAASSLPSSRSPSPARLVKPRSTTEQSAVRLQGVSRTLQASTSQVSSFSDRATRIGLTYLLGSVQYEEDVHHWARSSGQPSVCTVEPGNAADVGVAVRPLTFSSELHRP